jgi:nicotinate-nucleotide adenylyltransferase
MVETKNKSVGILGGSFDPPHRGHLSISKIAIKKINLNKVLWVVTKKNPFKNKPFYSVTQRIRFAKEITKKNKKIQVVYLDKIIGSSRTINIINYLIKKKIQKIYFIMGSDNLISFHKWKSWKKIVKLSKLIVFSRRGYDKKGMKSVVARYFKNKIVFIKNKPISISSSKLRKKMY